MINAIGIPLLYDDDLIGERNDALMKAAFLYDVPIYIYKFKDIDKYLLNGKVRALHWKDGEYRECYTDLPKYTEIYFSISTLRRYYPETVKWLEENTVITDDLGLYKYDFQRKLLLSELSQYAIPTILIHSFDELMQSAPFFPSAFLKPSFGRKAIGAMKLEMKDGKLCYSTPESDGELTRELFEEYYEAAGYDEDALLLLEPCLNIQNDDGRAVDFRCLVSLNGEGKWQNVLTYARIGSSGVASNISNGGSLNVAEETLEALIPGRGKEKLEEINRVALQIAEFVRKESHNPVSWLGLDVCVDRPSNQVYVIEANSKPGMKIVGRWELALVRAQYFKFLLSQTDI